MGKKVPCSVVSTTPFARVNRRGNLTIDDFGITVHTLEETVELVVFGEHRRDVVAALREIADRLEADDPSCRVEVAS